MAEEGLFRTNKPEEERRYQERLDYENMLKTQVMNVTTALTYNKDAVSATEVLLSMLIPELSEDIEEDLTRAQEVFIAQLDDIKYSYEVVSYKDWSNHIKERKKELDRNEVIHVNRLKSQCARNYVISVLKIVMNVLNERGMLLREERRIDEGGY